MFIYRFPSRCNTLLPWPKKNQAFALTIFIACIMTLSAVLTRIVLCAVTGNIPPGPIYCTLTELPGNVRPNKYPRTTFKWDALKTIWGGWLVAYLCFSAGYSRTASARLRGKLLPLTPSPLALALLPSFFLPALRIQGCNQSHHSTIFLIYTAYTSEHWTSIDVRTSRFWFKFHCFYRLPVPVHEKNLDTKRKIVATASRQCHRYRKFCLCCLSGPQ